jgi:hypothetical protein
MHSPGGHDSTIRLQHHVVGEIVAACEVGSAKPQPSEGEI